MKDRKYVVSSSSMLQIIDEEALLMNTDTRKFYELNESALVFWEIIQKYNDFNVVVNAILEHFEIAKDQVEVDLERFMNDLSKHGVIKFNAS